MYLVDLADEMSVPWLVNDPGHGYQVIGQLFEINEQGLGELDAFEEVGEPHGYIRTMLEIESIASPAEIMRVHSYTKRKEQLTPQLSRQGPFDEYRLEHAARYRVIPPTDS